MTEHHVLTALAASDEITPAGMAALWGNGNNINRFLAGRHDASEPIVTLARSANHPATRAARLATTHDPIELTAPTSTATEQRAIARNPHTPAEALEAIWRDSRIRISHIARNPNTPAHIATDALEQSEEELAVIAKTGTRSGAKVGSLLTAQPHLATRLASICSGSGARMLLEIPGIDPQAAATAIGRHRFAATLTTVADNPWIDIEHCASGTYAARRADLTDALGLNADHSRDELEQALTTLAATEQGTHRLLVQGSAAINRWLVARQPTVKVANGICATYGTYDTSPDLLGTLADAGGTEVARTIITRAGHTRVRFAADYSHTLERELTRNLMSPPNAQVVAYHAIEELGDNTEAWTIAVSLWASNTVADDEVAACAIAIAS